MAPKIAPTMVSRGDVVAPPWNPQVLLTCSGTVEETTLGRAIPNHPDHLDPQTPMVVVYGHPAAKPPHLILSESDRLWYVGRARKAG